MKDLKLRKDKKVHWCIKMGLLDHVIIHGGGGFTVEYYFILGVRSVWIVDDHGSDFLEKYMENFYVYCD